ncbi:MAG: exodeoxyribonuclease V subunit alpha [Acidobacteriota bacterium]
MGPSRPAPPAADGFTAVDRQLASVVGRLADADGELLAVSAALVSRDRGRGHSCLLLERHAGRAVVFGDTRRRLPALGDWRRRLLASSLVTAAEAWTPGSAATPLVLDARNRLYLWRYWRAESRVAARLVERAAAPPGERPGPDLGVEGIAGVETLGHLWRRLFQPDAGAIDWQAAGAATALDSRLAIISGGPGTGKTTTVVRMLALLHAAEAPQSDTKAPDIELAAPTGKAAARLVEAIQGQLAALAGEGLDLRPRLGTIPAKTLHRLLQYSPRSNRFGRNAERPLTCDVLVLDEASMVDLLMMDAVLDALPPAARLVLLGDRDQLSSVDAGFVFGDLCAAAGLGSGAPRLSAEQESSYRRFEPASAPHSADVEDLAESEAGLGRCGVELQVSYRFRERPGIGALARALRRGHGARAVDVLADPASPEVRRFDPPRAPGDAVAPVARALDAVFACPDAGAALAALDRFRILCATRTGRWGTHRLNEIVETTLIQAGHLDPSTLDAAGFYHGRAILVEENDYANELFNGDLGICWRDGRSDALWVHFAGDGTTRRVALAKLPRHSTAWAMTVHKSQGSELDHVLLVLGQDDPGGRLSRELLYTGVTRAREEVDVVAPAALIEEAAARSSRRTTGLADALGRASAGLEQAADDVAGEQ